MEVDMSRLNPPAEALLEVIGERTMVKVCREVGGQFIYIPQLQTLERSDRDERLIELYERGITYLEIAETFDITITRVRQLTQHLRPEGKRIYPEQKR